jgi:hypothetical protein
MDQAAYNNVHHNVTLFFSRYPHIRAEPDDDDVASAPQPAADLEPAVEEPSDEVPQDTVSPASPTSSEVTSPAESSELPAVESPVAHHPEIFLIGSPEPDGGTPGAPSGSADDEFMPDIAVAPSPSASGNAGTAPASAGTAPAPTPGVIPTSRTYETFQGNPTTYNVGSRSAQFQSFGGATKRHCTRIGQLDLRLGRSTSRRHCASSGRPSASTGLSVPPWSRSDGCSRTSPNRSSSL